MPKRRFGVAQFRRVDANRVAGFEEAGMAFGDPQPQHEILLRDLSDGFARQNDGAGGEWHFEDTAGRRCKHAAFAELLLNDRALRDARTHGIVGDIEGGARLVEARARDGAPAEQVLGAGQIGLGLRKLRLETGDLRVEGFHLQCKFLVADGCNDLTEAHMVAFLDGQFGDRATDARARRNGASAFDRGKDRLLVRHGGRSDNKGILRPRRTSCGNSEQNQCDNGRVHAGVLLATLCVNLR